MSYIYNRLPEVYRREDKEQGYFLRKYLESIEEGGFNPLILILKDIIATRYNTDLLPLEKVIKLGNNFGWKYDIRIPEDYQRRLIQHLVKLYKLKGTKPCLKYVSQDITGYPCEIEERYMGDLYSTAIKLHGDEDKPLPNIYTRKTLGFFLPYYINPILVIIYSFHFKPLIHMKHEFNINLFKDVNTNPWTKGAIDKLFNFDGTVNFDGSINFSGGKQGKGANHEIFQHIHKEIFHKVGSHDIILSPVFDGYYKFDGELKFGYKIGNESPLFNGDNLFNGKVNFGYTIDKERVLIKHTPSICGIIGVDSTYKDIIHKKDIVVNKQISTLFWSPYTRFNGDYKFDGSINFDTDYSKAILGTEHDITSKIYIMPKSNLTINNETKIIISNKVATINQNTTQKVVNLNEYKLNKFDGKNKFEGNITFNGETLLNTIEI